MSELTIYQCHKKVQGGKIVQVMKDRSLEGGAYLLLDCGVKIKAGPEFLERHKPAAGKYFLMHDDGYKSVSPGSVFEKGYKKIQQGDEQ